MIRIAGSRTVVAGALAAGRYTPARRAVPAGLLPNPSSLLKQLAADLIAGFFRTVTRWVASGTIWLLSEAWHFMSATTEPVLSGTAFGAEYHVMVLIGLGTVAPLLGVAVIQAIARQDASGLLRTALLRLPMALLLTGVVIELVSVGLRFTDQASVALLNTGGDPAARAFARIETALTAASPGGFGFGELLLIVVVAIVGFMLWVELAVRSAAVAVATLFLPLALAGLVWPATSHWARRLGETLAGLVLMKLVMAAVLALAGGALAAGAGGISSVIEGLALLASGDVLALRAFPPHPDRGERGGGAPRRSHAGAAAEVAGLVACQRSARWAGTVGLWLSPLLARCHGSPPRPKLLVVRRRPIRRYRRGRGRCCVKSASCRRGLRHPRQGGSLGGGSWSGEPRRTPMATPEPEAARYRLGPRSTRGLVAGWRTGQIACVAIGLLMAVGLLRTLGGGAGAVLGLLAAGAGVAVATWPVAGRTPEQWVPTLARFGARSLVEASHQPWRPAPRRHGSAFGGLVLTQLAEPGEWEPAWREGIESATARVRGGHRGDGHSDMQPLTSGIGVISDTVSQTRTAVVPVGGTGFALLSEGDRVERIAAWAGALAAMARDTAGMHRLQWLSSTYPSWLDRPMPAIGAVSGGQALRPAPAGDVAEALGARGVRGGQRSAPASGAPWRLRRRGIAGPALHAQRPAAGRRAGTWGSALANVAGDDHPARL